MQKFKFSGPDPPSEPVKAVVEDAQEEEKKSVPSKGKAKEEVTIEVELTEEEKAEL